MKLTLKPIKNDYTYRWMRAIGKQPRLSRCVVMSCTERGRIIHNGIAMKEKIEDLLHEKCVQANTLFALANFKDFMHLGQVRKSITCSGTME